MSDASRGRYIGLNRGPSAIDGLRPDVATAQHNRTVPADAQADACPCPMCADLRANGLPDLNAPMTEAEQATLDHALADLYPPSAAARVAGPAAAILATPADARRPVGAVVMSTPSVAPGGPAETQFMRRGPVQDESKFCDPFDSFATRAVEGRSFVTDGDA